MNNKTSSRFGIALLTLLFMLSCGFVFAQTTYPRFVPYTAQVDYNLVRVNPSGLTERSIDELSMITLQGLVNRTKPKVYISKSNYDPGEDGWWLLRYIDFGYVTANPAVLTYSQFFTNYKQYATGVVIPPSNLGIRGYYVAVMKAAITNAIVGTQTFANTYSLPVIENYSSRFNSYLETFDYALEYLFPYLSKEAIITSTGIDLMDYALMHKLFVFSWQNQDEEEKARVKRLYANTLTNIPVIGMSGTNTPEGTHVTTLSLYGKYYYWVDQKNSTIHSAMPHPSTSELQQSYYRTPPTLDSNKIYVAIKLSDGDSVNHWRKHVMRSGGAWSVRGQIPLGWEMGSSIFDFCPGICKYVYSTKTTKDEIAQCISGGSYMFPGDFALAEEFDDWLREQTWSKFLQNANDLRKYMHQDITSVHHFEDRGDRIIGNEIFSRYINAMPGMLGMLNGYQAVADSYRENHRTVNNAPVFHYVTDNTITGNIPSLADDLRAHAPSMRPGFMLIYANGIGFQNNIDYVKQQLQILSAENYELVLPRELALLYRQAYNLPTVTPWPTNIPTWTATNTPTRPSTWTPTVTSTPTPIGTPMPNAFKNPGFESDLSYWTHQGDGRVTVSEFSVFTHGGTKMFGWVHNGCGGGETATLTQLIGGLSIGSCYRAKCWLYTKVTDGTANPPVDNMHMEFICDPTGGNSLENISGQLYNDNMWKEQFAYFWPSSSQPRVGVRLTQDESLTWNHIYVDDFSLDFVPNVPIFTPTITKTPTPTVLPGRLANNSFEFGNLWGWAVKPHNWTMDILTNITNICAGVTPPDGSYMAGWMIPGNGMRDETIHQSVITVPGRSYIFSAKVYTKDSVGDPSMCKARVVADLDDEDIFPIAGEWLSTNGQWQTATVTFTAVHSNTRLGVNLHQEWNDGTNILFCDQASLTDTEITCVKGDINCDNSVTPGDALLAFQFYLKVSEPNPGASCDQFCAADYDDSGAITPGDALCVFRKYLNNPC